MVLPLQRHRLDRRRGVLIVFFSQDSDIDNRYGPSPKPYAAAQW